jgi:CheY-like chemotaxis protein
MGISTEQQVLLFQPFSQVSDSYTKNVEGTGLGLTISQNLVQLMGSSIKLDSQMGIGSCFSFELRLPMADLAPIEPDVSPTLTLTQSPEALSGVRILIVEDGALVQKVTNGHLKRLGASIKLTNNGLEALAALEQQTFDIVLMDLHMPGMDGFETTIEIRKRPHCAQLPVIAFSAGVSDDVKQRSLAAGMNDFVAKPLNIIELVATLEKWLKR